MNERLLGAVVIGEAVRGGFIRSPVIRRDLIGVRSWQEPAVEPPVLRRKVRP